MRPRGDGKGTGASAKLNTFDVTSLVVGSIIGADVYIATAIGARLVGPSSLLAWILAGAMAMVIALSFSYCVMILPKVGERDFAEGLPARAAVPGPSVPVGQKAPTEA